MARNKGRLRTIVGIESEHVTEKDGFTWTRLFRVYDCGHRERTYATLDQGYPRTMSGKGLCRTCAKEAS